jgi:hypothetical protein
VWWCRCPACFKQFSSDENLVRHLEKAGHTEHEPQCGACHKHCFCFESLREHLLGISSLRNRVYEILRTPLSFAFVISRVKVAKSECH